MHIASAEAMEDLGRELGRHCPAGSCIHLQGDLGAGKTTLVRGFLYGRGYAGKVKSPTYTLVEPYTLAGTDIFHFDLYRLLQPEEIENIGFRDYFDGQSIVLIEWPEKAAGLLASADLLISIQQSDTGRQVHWQANSATGRDLVDKIQGPECE